MLDYVIRGGQVVTPAGVGSWDVGIRGEKIVAIAEPGTLTDNVGRVIDATGKIVVPGGIEPHAHVAAPIMGHPGAETAPPDQVSRAALFGGTTTVVDFAIQHPERDIFAAIDERNGRWHGQSYADYTYHCMLLGNISSEIMAQIPQVIEAGFPTFKIFTTNIRPNVTDRMARLGHVAAVMEEVTANNGLMVVHAEDDDIVQFLYQRLKEQGTYDWTNMHRAHTHMSEDISFRRIIRAAEWTGAAVYFVHVSAKEGVQAIREARGKGLPIYGETLHNYVSFTADDYQKPGYHTYRPQVREAVRPCGTACCMAICILWLDEYCTTFALKISKRILTTSPVGTMGPGCMGITTGRRQ
jgi:dihydropyrimidinase